MKNRWQIPAVRVALLYAATATLWIASSDTLAGFLFSSIAAFKAVSLAKGFVFVLVTSVGLYAVVRRLLRTECEARNRAEQTARELAELRTIAEHGGELLYKHDLNNRFAYVSPKVCPTWNRSRQ